MRRNLELKARDRDPPRSAPPLASTLGVTTVVVKSRGLFLHEGVRVHLDRVEDLGGFVDLLRARSRTAT